MTTTMSIPSLPFLNLNRIILLPVKFACSRNIIQTNDFHLTRYLSASNGPPKGLLRPYLKFFFQILPELKIKYPTSSRSEQLKIAAKQWYTLHISERKKILDSFHEEYENLLIERLLKKAKTEKNLHVVEDSANKKKKEKAKLKELRRLSGEPKRPIPPFLLYSVEKHRTLPNEKLGKEYARKLGEQYRNMPEEEKMKYITEYKKSKEAYKVAYNEWEMKLIEQGATDIFPKKTRFRKNPSGTKDS